MLIRPLDRHSFLMKIRTRPAALRLLAGHIRLFRRMFKRISAHFERVAHFRLALTSFSTSRLAFQGSGSETRSRSYT